MFWRRVFPIVIVSGIAAGAIAWPEFFHLPSLALTVGGSVTVTGLSYSKKQLLDLFHVIRVVFGEKPPCLQDRLDELTRLTQLFRLEGLKGLEHQERNLTDAFLKHAVGMLIDLDKEEKIRGRLEQLLSTVIGKQEISRQILLTLGKLLPSFGLIGTLIGMVLLLRNIAAQNAESLPSALGLAVLTTLYGAVLANVIVAPLAARLHAIAVENEMRMRVTIDWVTIIIRGGSASTVGSRFALLPPPVEIQAHR